MKTPMGEVLEVPNAELLHLSPWDQGASSSQHISVFTNQEAH